MSVLGWSRGRLRSLRARLYAAFLLAAVLPTAVAGVVGIYASLQALRQETLLHLQRQVAGSARGLERYFEQLRTQMLYLARSAELGALIANGSADGTTADGSAADASAQQAVQAEWLRLVRSYPYLGQIRFIARSGHERLRVDYRDSAARAAAADALQDKSGRYYFREAMALAPGQVYVSPLDLNVEHEQVEQPQHPVIRLATPIAGADGAVAGILVVNLDAGVILSELDRMLDARPALAYLIDRGGHYLGGEADATPRTALNPLANLAQAFGAATVDDLLASPASARSGNGWVVAHQGIDTFADDRGTPQQWIIALAYPERELFLATLNLYVLYAVLAVALLTTGLAGYVVSGRLLGPLQELSRETEAIAAGNFSRRIAVRGHDEIAALGRQFNVMAEQLSQIMQKLHRHREQLEEQVAARTQDLARQRAQLAAVVDGAAEGIVVARADGTVVLANDAAARALGDAPADILCSPDFSAVWQRLTAAATHEREARLELDWQQRVLALAITRIDDAQGTGDFILLIRDVSGERRLQDERRELDRQMFQMEKMASLGELAMGVAHEIGNPLAGMKAVAQAIRYEEDLPIGLAEAVGRLESEVDRLAGFLRSFHGFAASRPLQPVATALPELLNDVLFWVRKDAQGKGIALHTDVPADLPPLTADPQQLKQVLLNLLVNAVHAMPNGGELAIGARVVEDRTHIAIRDTGIGIDPAHLTAIFEPFYTTRADGTGLGLAIVAKIVHDHDARIGVSSEPGAGTCFNLFWPLAEGNHHA